MTRRSFLGALDVGEPRPPDAGCVLTEDEQRAVDTARREALGFKSEAPAPTTPRKPSARRLRMWPRRVSRPSTKER
jgi:hypothetical protein